MTEKLKAEKKQVKLTIFDMQGKRVDEMESPFNGRSNPAVVSQAITMYLANKRSGLASAKTRGEVSGGCKKPWRQKGTGRARAGSTRSPLWRHGGIVFGPRPRNFHYSLPAKIRNLALRSALNEKSAKADILVLDTIELSSAKTKEIKKLLDNFKVKEKTLIVLARYEKNLKLASQNMPLLSLARAGEVNALDVLKAKKIIFTKEALSIVCRERLGLKKDDK